ncbi:GFA family protein [Laribacter hongkongensis]|uniref:GFA family protein n=1 Tax=Laribacter hongkongensis TaxID=168471 RepID=A0ABD4SPM7_9NEIS|nr:GFA family protein [Laribacter hongkongensis]MCG9024511.1 GFA family protein [Laribacter hongkongensis]MCG9096808.1 GFA family protein [Laribacter hongkongensis]MCG9099546.1 GFA family protein [Laribacter hongkongensis]MCG9104000.1 GFA family protein [Laribacter hongkongensis]MCG9111671.1 GFA family protein [Laribacter hongkongensis]
MTERHGGCLCGQVRYRLTADPVRTLLCWCRDCQRLAANGTVNALVPSGALVVEGDLREYGSVADSGHHAVRRFCPVCGTHLFGNSTAFAQFTLVRTGTLDDPSSVRPQANIWVRRAPDWAVLDEKLPQWDGQPVASRPA